MAGQGQGVGASAINLRDAFGNPQREGIHGFLFQRDFCAQSIFCCVMTCVFGASASRRPPAASLVADNRPHDRLSIAFCAPLPRHTPLSLYLGLTADSERAAMAMPLYPWLAFVDALIEKRRVRPEYEVIFSAEL